MEQVVLLNESLAPCGIMPKSKVHTTNTPLHLAFSCYLLNDKNELLMTRRSLNKKAWPGVWSNSFCGHPLPDESLSSAVHRRGQWELGVDAQDIQLIDNSFRYEATDTNGIKENEYCPIFIAKTSATPALNPDEAMDYQWVHYMLVLELVAHAPRLISPWMSMQLKNSNLQLYIR